MIRVLQLTKKGYYRWIDGSTGYPIPKPTLGQLKKDSIGRPRDDSAKSRMVPMEAIAPTRKYEPEPIIESTRVFRLTDKENKKGFWYWKETGRRAPKPGLNDVKYTETGQIRDDVKGRVPKWAIRKDVIKPSIETVKTKPKVLAPELPKKSAKTDDRFMFPEVRTGTYPELEPTKFTNYSHGNRSDGSDLESVFAEAFTNHLNKGPFEPSDVGIYKHGVQIRMDKRLSVSEQRDIQQYLGKFPGTSVQFVEEQRVTTFLIIWGDNDEPQYAKQVFDQLHERKKIMQNVLTYFDEFGEYYDWWAFWDTADEMYEFGH